MFFANRIYSNKVLFRTEELLLEYLGPSDGSEAMGGLIGVTKLLGQLGRLDLPTLLKTLRKAGLSVDDAAVCLIDGTVTALKELADESGSKEASETLIPLFERALDQHMSKRPGKVVPRNGAFGRAASEHLGAFIKDVPGGA